MDNILNIILNNTYSLHQLKHRLSILKTYLQNTLFGATPSQIQPADLLWLKSLPPSFFQNFNASNLSDTFIQLEKSIASLKTLTLYLTFEPDDEALSQIGQAIRKLFGQLLLDIKYDPSLIAGAALVWQGVYKDYSLRSKIEDKKGMILQSFKKFLR